MKLTQNSKPTARRFRLNILALVVKSTLLSSFACGLSANAGPVEINGTIDTAFSNVGGSYILTGDTNFVNRNPIHFDGGGCTLKFNANNFNFNIGDKDLNVNIGIYIHGADHVFGIENADNINIYASGAAYKRNWTTEAYLEKFTAKESINFVARDSNALYLGAGSGAEKGYSGGYYLFEAKKYLLNP